MPTLLSPLLQGALTGLHGPWQDVYRYPPCTLHFKVGFAQVPIEVILCVQIQLSSPLEHPLAFRPSSIVHENLYSRGQPRHQCLPFQVECVEDANRYLAHIYALEQIWYALIGRKVLGRCCLQAPSGPGSCGQGSCPMRRFPSLRYLIHILVPSSVCQF
jgi:hypothetical protein